MAADKNVNKNIVLNEWDCHAEKVKLATTVEQLAPSLAFFFMAMRPFVERETVTEEDCAKKMEGCAAHALIVGGTTHPAVTALINRSPLLALVLLLGYVVYHIFKILAS